MYRELLLRNVSKYIVFDLEDREYLSNLLRFEKVKKHQVLLEEGEINSRVMFVNKGCLRSYVTDKSNVEHVLSFAPEGWWSVDMLSFITQEPARLSIDAVEDSEIVYLLKSDFDTIHLQIPAFSRFGRILTMNGISSFQHRQIDNLSLTAMERYQKFCTLYPSLISALPHYQVASYIGVTPEFLARMLNTAVLS